MKTNCLFLVLAALALTGCSVYAPMQPTIVGIREAGQVQASGSLQASGRAELGAVYAPAAHVLLMGAGSYRPKTTDSLHFGTRQWEAGAGTYWPLGDAWVLSGLGGFGQAATERRWSELLGTSLAYRASYRKTFGQVGVDFNNGRSLSMGLAYRFTRLDFDELSYSGHYTPTGRATGLRNDRHEVLFYSRRTLPWGLGTTWQLQSTLGLALETPDLVASNAPGAYAINANRRAVPLCSFGLVYTFTPNTPRQP